MCFLWRWLCCKENEDGDEEETVQICRPKVMNNEVKKWIALYDFEPEISDDLYFLQGDIIEVTDIPELNYTLWALGFNTRTKQRGYVPLTYLAEENSLDSYAWYFPDATETSANILLLNDENRDGSFLVRPKMNTNTPYILSLRYTRDNKPTVIHYLIYYEDNQYYISRGAEKPSLGMLIDLYYKKDSHNLLNLRHALEAPCKQQKPLLYEISGYMTTNLDIKDSEISLGSILGRGNSGEVYMAKYISKQVVVKKLLNFDKSKFDVEVENMKILRHKNIVSLYGVCRKSEPYYIVLEYMDRGELKKYVENNKLTNEQNIYIISQITCGLAYLERKSIIHRDIAARNILLDKNLTAKISDFGLSRNLSLKTAEHADNTEVNHLQYQMLSVYQLPILWLAPECFNFTFSTKSDVWAFAITVIEIYTRGAAPYKEWGPLEQSEFKARISSGNTMKRPKNLSADIYQLLISCWNVDPQKRPSSNKLWQYFNELANRESQID